MPGARDKCLVQDDYSAPAPIMQSYRRKSFIRDRHHLVEFDTLCTFVLDISWIPARI